MNRRTMLASAATALTTALASPLLASGGSSPSGKKTRWKVRTSEGFDAIAFLGPLAGGSLYLEHYAADADAFAPQLPGPVRRDIEALWKAANDEGFGLLGPNLQVLFSGGNDFWMDTLLTALRERETRILPGYRASRYWSEADWAWFSKAASRLEAIFAAMRDAGFAAFRADRVRGLDARSAEVQRALDSYDVITWQEKLTGRAFDPTIEVVLLQFAKPHGIKVQGQTFLQSANYDTATTVRIAAHEMLHPPFDPKGSAAQSALAVLRRDTLIEKIVREHNPQLGYTTLEGLLDEDVAQALDQLISEALGVARNPADRWRKADDGIHVIAGGLYGLLREDRWIDRGGSIEQWLELAAKSGRLDPKRFHASATRVLQRAINGLWPLQENPR